MRTRARHAALAVRDAADPRPSARADAALAELDGARVALVVDGGVVELLLAPRAGSHHDRLAGSDGAGAELGGGEGEGRVRDAGWGGDAGRGTGAGRTRAHEVPRSLSTSNALLIRKRMRSSNVCSSARLRAAHHSSDSVGLGLRRTPSGLRILGKCGLANSTLTRVTRAVDTTTAHASACLLVAV